MTPTKTTLRSWTVALLVVGSALVLIGGGMVAGGFAVAALSAGRSGSCDAARVADQVLPSVVTIAVVGQRGTSNGSGEIITDDGHILTNNHVVADAASGARLTVRFSDGHELPAKLTGRDPKTDLAVITVSDDEPLPVIATGDSGSLAVGQPVVALGAPLGLSSTVTAGIVSALGRTVPVPSDDDRNAVLAGAIQTDASINPGNSGGALVDCSGRLVGINTAIATVPGSAGQSSTGSVGIGFAVPESLALPIADELIAHGRVAHPEAGLTVVPIPPAAAAKFGVTDGLFVQSIVSGGPAQEAGLRVGDVITSVNGHAATNIDVLTAIQVTNSAGDEVRVEYIRDGATHTTTLTLE
ncbi:S1C family serine protease [uncultured Leifsonia sp.]|uniref:S1C family serine protease n=1 Tax=uncultured Leifsonia sp. TaxID=340359 RepID=UPI0025F697B4|nr:trypsin-like peptidase domain-containing protein [uncultured Leifsonia sp.]